MIGLIFFIVILILLSIGLYYLYKNGYIPYTTPFFEKKQEELNDIVNEIMEKSLNPDITLHKDIQFLDIKLDKIKGMFIFSPELKEYIIESHYDNLSFAITTLINHHTADLVLSTLCDSDTNEAEIMINSPGYTKIRENQNNVNKFFSNQQDL